MFWKESSLIVKATSLDAFQQLLRDEENYKNWLHKCRLATPLKDYDTDEMRGYFGFSFKTPVGPRHVICWSDLEIDANTKMILNLKKDHSDQSAVDNWKNKRNTHLRAGVLRSYEIKNFEGVYSFTKINGDEYKVELKVGIEVSRQFYQKSKRLKKFVQEIVTQTLKKLKVQIESGKYGA